MIKTPITVTYGDGIGPEIMEATLKILEAAGAELDIETIEVGEKVYLSGYNTGIKPESWDSLRRTKVFLKAPITTPQGGGIRSLNVTARKMFGLYANVRPCYSYHPFIKTKHPVIDVTVIRENEEDLYAGIEYRQTRQVTTALKLISRPGTEKIIRYAFEYARSHNRKKVSCFIKDNIMKITDGLFHKVYDEIGAEYPEIEKDTWIVDIGAARLATVPESFDVIVLENLYGDILSDVIAQMAGSIGMGGSSNIGDEFAMFEAIHGSAPKLAGKNIANPSGLILGAVMMLVHIGQNEVASKVHNAWLKTIEDGIHTYDLKDDVQGNVHLGTREFANAVIERLGEIPKILKKADYVSIPEQRIDKFKEVKHNPERKDLVGVDVFIDWNSGLPEDIGNMMRRLKVENLELQSISNRGVKVFPEASQNVNCSDQWVCRYKSAEKGMFVTHNNIIELLTIIRENGFDFVKIENLYNFDGAEGYSK